MSVDLIRGLSVAIDDNNYPLAKDILETRQTTGQIYQKNGNEFPLSRSVKTHNAQIFGLILNKLEKLKDVKQIQPDPNFSLFSEHTKPIQIDSHLTPQIIAAGVRTLLDELKKCRQLDAESPLITMVEALEKSEIVNDNFKAALSNTLATLIKSYGHTDVSRVAATLFIESAGDLDFGQPENNRNSDLGRS